MVTLCNELVKVFFLCVCIVFSKSVFFIKRTINGGAGMCVVRKFLYRSSVMLQSAGIAVEDVNRWQ